VILLFLDLSAAFDTVDYKIIILRLEECVAIEGCTLNWLKSYLNARTFSFHFYADDTQIDLPLKKNCLIFETK